MKIDTSELRYALGIVAVVTVAALAAAGVLVGLLCGVAMVLRYLFTGAA